VPAKLQPIRPHFPLIAKIEALLCKTYRIAKPNDQLHQHYASGADPIVSMLGMYTLVIRRDPSTKTPNRLR
jgi:hypothetical protein